MPNKFKQRFVELETQLKQVVATKKTEYSQYDGESRVQVDRSLKLAWEVKAKHLLEMVCGPDFQHFKQPNGAVWFHTQANPCRRACRENA